MEMYYAGCIGVRQNVESVMRNRQQRYESGKDDRWRQNVEGLCGEVAVAKALNVYWEPKVNSFKTRGDLAGFEVRTRSRHDYELLVRDQDPDDRAYVLVTGVAPNFVVRGWMLGKDAKQAQWRMDHGNAGQPAYFVPQMALRPIEDLLVRTGEPPF
jgi:hypothetical protein